MQKQDEIRIQARHLAVLGVAIAVAALLFFVFKGETNTVEGQVRPAEYDFLEDAAGKKRYSIEVNEGGYEFLPGTETDVYSYNGQIPGPLIKGKAGDAIRVDVKNNLGEPTTIHFHGLILKNAHDGVPQITQNSIMPGEKFRYEIELRNPGLYWYHSHADAHRQVESGLSGAILIEDESRGMDEGNLIVLDDVLLGDDRQFMDFNLGVMHGRFGNWFLVNGELNPDVSLKNNRLRIVNTANARSFNLNFGGRQFTVMGMDIGSSEIYRGSTLAVHPGERYDLLLDAAREETIEMRHLAGDEYYSLARLSMEGDAIKEVPEPSFSLPFSAEEILKKEPDFNVELYGFQGGSRGIVWSINGKYFPDTTEIFEVSEGDVVKIRLKNLQGQPHPMHLHGQKFAVIARNGKPEENLGWKDTVMVGSFEEADIVFKAEEKGDWVFHCHILEHTEAGMLSIVRVS